MRNDFLELYKSKFTPTRTLIREQKKETVLSVNVYINFWCQAVDRQRGDS